MRIALLGSLLACVLSVGCAAQTDDAGEDQAAILEGALDYEHPGVGQLAWATSAGTGVLVAPDLVLTAAHVAAGKPTRFYYGVPAEGALPKRTNLPYVEVEAAVIHPCYEHRTSACPGGTGEPIDIALVKLKTPVPSSVAPIPVVRGDWETIWNGLAPWQGQTCTAVGFGAHYEANGKASYDTRRHADVTISRIQPTEIETVRKDGIATSGDSGGPLLCNGHVVGTVRGSAGPTDKNRIYERTVEAYERVQLHTTWLEETAKAFGSSVVFAQPSSTWQPFRN